MDGVIRRAKALDDLDRTLRPHLPEPLASHCRLANFRDGALIFLVDAPVWRSRLRLHGEILIAAATAAGIPARRVEGKVAQSPPAAVPKRAQPSLSVQSRESLRQTAESLDDPELREALLRLASLPRP